jgi:hypothetical protein
VPQATAQQNCSSTSQRSSSSNFFKGIYFLTEFEIKQQVQWQRVQFDGP